MDEIKIVEIRVRNFCCLKNVNLKLDDLTVFMGQNDSGKTSLIQALNKSIGASNQKFTEEDIYLSSDENRIPKDRSIIVDLLIRPWDRAKQEFMDNFPQGSYWTYLWANGISHYTDGTEFCGMRFEFKLDRTRMEYRKTGKFLNEWKKNPEDIMEAKIKESEGAFYFNKIEPLALYLMDEKRDIRDEFRNRSSFWHKLISEPDIEPVKLQQLEEILNQLNKDIIEGSKVLTDLSEYLNKILPVISHLKGKTNIFPIPRQLDDLSKGIDIGLSTDDSQIFSLTRHGMGIRSIATIILFNAFVDLKQKELENGKMHPLLAIEEPENHLHPQAQRAIFDFITKISGQVIITTHSPYIIEQAKIQNIRCFQKIGAETIISKMNVEDLTDEDLRKLHRMVLKTRGYILYARGLVLMGGETDEQGLPVFAQELWKQTPDSINIEFVGVGGDGNYLPFLRLAQSFNIPWYIFSDGEDKAISDVNNALSKIDELLYPDNPNVFVIPDGKNYETYLIREEYKKELIKMMIDLLAKNEMHRQALEKEWNSKTDPIEEIINFAKNHKIKCALPLAKAITSKKEKELKFPEMILSLLEKIIVDFKISLK